MGSNSLHDPQHVNYLCAVPWCPKYVGANEVTRPAVAPEQDDRLPASGEPAHGSMIPVHILRAIKEGAVVIIGPDGMGEAEIRAAVVDALLGLKREPERPRVYLMAPIGEEPP